MADKRPSPGRTASAARASQRSSGNASSGSTRTATTTRATASTKAATKKPGSSSSTKTRTTSARGSSGKSSTGRTSRTTTPARPPWPIRAVRGVWMGIAHGVGGAARSIGSGARGIDPAVRRDGLALLLVGLAIAVAAREWFGLTGSGADVIHMIAAGAVGHLAIVVPVLLVVLAIRLMRHPDRGADNGRVSIGWAFIAFAACGLLAVAFGLPEITDGWYGLRGAGGILGWVAANPLSGALTAWVAVPVLVLVAFFGVLVITATPVRSIPERMRELTGRGHEDHVDEEDEEDYRSQGLATPPPGRRARGGRDGRDARDGRDEDAEVFDVDPQDTSTSEDPYDDAAAGRRSRVRGVGGRSAARRRQRPTAPLMPPPTPPQTLPRRGEGARGAPGHRRWTRSRVPTRVRPPWSTTRITVRSAPAPPAATGCRPRDARTPPASPRRPVCPRPWTPWRRPWRSATRSPCPVNTMRTPSRSPWRRPPTAAGRAWAVRTSWILR